MLVFLFSLFWQVISLARFRLQVLPPLWWVVAPVSLWSHLSPTCATGSSGTWAVVCIIIQFSKPLPSCFGSVRGMCLWGVSPELMCVYTRHEWVCFSASLFSEIPLTPLVSGTTYLGSLARTAGRVLRIFASPVSGYAGCTPSWQGWERKPGNSLPCAWPLQVLTPFPSPLAFAYTLQSLGTCFFPLVPSF